MYPKTGTVWFSPLFKPSAVKYLVSATSSRGAFSKGGSLPRVHVCSQGRVEALTLFSRHLRKQEFFGFHLLYRRRGRCSTPGLAVKTTQTGRSFYKPEAYRVSPLYHGGAAARLRQRSVQTSQWWRAFQGRGFLSLFFVSKNLFPQYYICKIHI